MLQQAARRPLFRVWGYAPTRESVISHTFTHHGAKRSRTANSAIIAMDLHRKSTTEHLVAYITTHHESLVALLPPDTTCADVFGEVPGEVENSRHW